MIELTKINGEQIIVNCRLIEYIVAIPETKIIMANGRYHIVKEPSEEIIRKVLEFEKKVAEGIGTPEEKLARCAVNAACNTLELNAKEKEEN